MQTTQTKTNKLISFSKADLLWTTGLIMVAIVAPAIFAHTPQNQWVTGTIVNAVLFVSAWRLGVVNAVLIGILPSSIALMQGLLLPPQVMIIPYIVISNVILISIFSALKKQPLVGIFMASFFKFLFLAGITSLFFSGKLPAMLLQMMQWSQLVTALAGGFIALALIKKLAKN
jgi:uncharacterized membrane protein